VSASTSSVRVESTGSYEVSKGRLSASSLQVAPPKPGATALVRVKASGTASSIVLS
jgi:hypothetical protein